MIIGVRESAFLNKIFTIVNILILGFIIIAGATRIKSGNNWNVNPSVSYSNIFVINLEFRI